MIAKPIANSRTIPKWIIARLCLGILTAFPAALTYAQLWFCSENNIFLAGQKPARISRLEIINISNEPWNKRTVIEIELPQEFQAEWDIATTKVYSGRVTLKPTLKVVNNRIIKITGLRRIPTHDGIIIKGLTIKNFRGSSPFRPLQIRINGEAARLASNLGLYKRWGKKSEPNRYLKPFVNTYRFLASHLTNTSPLITLVNKSKAKGYFRIASLQGGIKENASFITGASTCEIPPVVIRNDSINSILNKNTILDIHFPTGLVLKQAPLTITPRKRAHSVFIDKKNIVRIIIDKKIKAGDEIQLTGILAKSGAKVIPPRSLTLDWKKTPKEIAKKISLKNTIQVGNPAVKIADAIELVANTGEKTIPAITIRENKKVTALLPGKTIILKIPGNIKARWSRNTKELEISGTATKKIKGKPKFIDNKTLAFEVITPWKPNDFLKISGLKMSAVKRTPDDIKGKKIVLHRPLMVLFDKPQNKANRLTKKDIKIVEVDMTSLGQQVLLPKDEYEEMNPVRITIRSDFPTLRRGDKLKFQLSKSLQAQWFLGLNKVDIFGKSKLKVSEKITFDFNKTPPQLILNIKENFTGNEEFIIRGLLLQAKNPSRGSLKLFLNANTTPMAVDSNNWIVQYPLFTSKDNQIIFNDDDITNTFPIIIETRQLEKYFQAGKHFQIIIPASSPITFNRDNTELSLYGRAEKYLDNKVQYPDAKTAQIEIKYPIPNNTILTISGLQYAQPTGLTTTPDTLLISIDDIAPFVSKISYEVVSKKSEFKRAEYYHKLALSNFSSGDTLFLELDESSTIQWDTDYISNKVSFLYAPAEGSIDLRYPIFLNGNKVLGFKIKETVGVTDYFRIQELAITRGPAPDFTYLTLRSRNLTGQYLSYLRYPLNMGKRGPTRPRQVPRLLRESYVFPIIKLVKEGDKNRLTTDKERLIIPPIEIQNGNLLITDRKIFMEYSVAAKRIKNLLRKWGKQRKIKYLEDANELADDLIRKSPNTWLGYYRKAQILKEMGEFIDESHRHYAKAKQLGYIPSNAYPQIYLDDINDQARFDIYNAENLIASEDYVKAEKTLKTVIQLPIDSLKYEIRGTAYFLLGDIALRLDDCIYADNYLYEAETFGTIDPTKYNLNKAYARLEECSQNQEMVVADAETYIPVRDPIEETDELSERLKIRLITSFPYPYSLAYEDRNSADIQKVRIGDEFAISTEKIYRLYPHPIRSQLLNLSISMVFLFSLLGLSYFK